MIQSCLNGKYLMNVVLLQDGMSPWSMNFVKPAVMKAIETDAEINYSNGRCLLLENKLFYTFLMFVYEYT